VVMVEALDEAMARTVKVYAEVAGFGAGQSGLVMSGLGLEFERAEDGPAVNHGLAGAIESALDDAGIKAGEVDAIVPAAMGVGWLDRAEAGALRAVFGARLASVPLVTTRPFVGECMAGAGALQLAVGAKMVAEQMLPARLHGSKPADGLLAGTSSATSAVLKTVLVCSSSMGGQNAAIVLRRVESVGGG